MEKITKNAVLSEILADQKMAEILTKHNLPCLSCPFAKYEIEQLKIGEVCEQYGINAEKLLEELNLSLIPQKSVSRKKK
jgi:hybrid cluster-associated redox disulfide protein